MSDDELRDIALKAAARAAAIDDLAEDVETLTVEARAARVELRDERLWRRRMVRFFLVAMLVIAIQFAFLTALAFGNRHLADQIRSCTTPQGKCAKRGAETQRQAICQLIVDNHALHGVEPPKGCEP